MQHAFIVGCPRSGTSWVRNILDQHPRVKCGPESHLFEMVQGVVDSAENGTTPWASLLTSYDGFAENTVGPHRWIDRTSFADLVRSAAESGEDSRAAGDRLVALVFAHYARRNRLGDDSVLVEKTPRHLFHAEQIKRTFPDARFVELRRDGRDVSVSMERRALNVDWPPRHRKEQIDAWRVAVAEGLRLSTQPEFADRWHVVKYEDLISDRSAEIAALYEFLGLAHDPELLRGVIDRTHISQVKRTGDGEHVRKGVAGDWPNFFSGADLELFFERAGDVFAAAGYRREAP